MELFFIHLAAVTLAGAGAVRLLPPAERSHLYALSLGWGLGAGLASILAISSLVLTRTWSGWLLAFEILVAMVLVAARMRKGSGVPRKPAEKRRRERWCWPLVAATGLLLATAVVLFVLITIAKPHGRWDAWMIWNLRARFLFRSPADWAHIFSPLIVHADYPLLLPLNVALGWVMARKETVVVPAAIAMLFTLAPAGLLAGYFRLRNMTSRGLIAAICLLGTPFYLYIGVDQVADPPVSLYFLATIVLLHRADESDTGRGRHLLLAGLMAGLAAWTKNEGLLFIPVVLFSRLFVPGQRIRNYLSSMAWFAAGLLPLVVVIACFKLGLAPANDLWASRSAADILAKLTDIHRYLQVARAYGKVVYGFSYWPPVSLNLLLLVYALVAGIAWRQLVGALRWLLLILLVMPAGYFLVFVLTPHDLTWHLTTALERLFLQLYPTALLLYFLTVAQPAPAPDPEARPSGSRDINHGPAAAGRPAKASFPAPPGNSPCG